MSSDYVLVCYGVRYELSDDEADAYECKRDPRIARMRRANLQWWYGPFAGGAPGGREGNGERMFLFVGAIIGTFGHEGKAVVRLTGTEFQELVATTNARLAEAGFEGEPALHVQFAPDN